MRSIAIILVTHVLLICGATLAADEVDDSRRIYRDAVAAYQKKDYATFLEKARAASELRPSHPALLLSHSAALALNGQREAALALLERVASMGFVTDTGDDDFTSLRGLPRFDAVVKRFEANTKPIGQARPDFTIDRLGLVPEGMAYDEGGKRWFVSSVRTRTIFSVNAKGEVSELAKDLPWGIFGMVYDGTRGVLWAVTGAVPQVDGFRAEDQGKSALLKIDPRSGRVIETLSATEGGKHQFGDVALAPDGTVYVSDSAASTIYRIHGKTLAPVVRGPFSSLQGLAVYGSLLYAADYAKGIFVIDRRTLHIRPLPVPPNVSVLGIDGLYMAGAQTLIGTQNGTNPNRIVRIRLASGGHGIASVETLLANVGAMGDPTLGVIAGGRFYFNGNAQWDLFAEDGTITDPVKLKEAVVLSVPLR
jgi:hypothetical protein